MMKNGVYFTVIALLVAELFKIFIFPNEVTCDFQPGTESGVCHKKMNISHDVFCIELKLSTVVTLITKFHDLSTVTIPWQHYGLQVLSMQFFSFKKCYLLLLFIQ